jgi:hypothetical protein
VSPTLAQLLTDAGYAIVIALATWLASKLTAYLDALSTRNKAATALDTAWHLMSSLVAHAEVALRPTIKNALSEGKLTPEEGAKLKAAVLQTFKQTVGNEGLAELEAALGVAQGGTVDTFLSGLVERTLGIQRAAGTLPPPVPGAALVARIQGAQAPSVGAAAVP